MKKLLLALVFLAGCHVTISDPDCMCLPDEVCIDGMCVYNTHGYPRGTQTGVFTCDYDGFDFYEGKVIPNVYCSSGVEIVQKQIGCCEYWNGSCIASPLGTFCM